MIQDFRQGFEEESQQTSREKGIVIGICEKFYLIQCKQILG